MPQYRVIERQVRTVEYVVNADDEAMAREHVQMLGADEYDCELEAVETSILFVQEVISQ